MALNIPLDLVDQIQIAAPCSARWEEMKGDERARVCGQCRLKVYNLSAMGRDEAAALLRDRLGSERVCARVYRRHDGTILTQDCPVGLAALRARARRTIVRIVAACVALFSATAFAQWRSSQHEQYPFTERASVRDFGVASRLTAWLRGTAAPPRGGGAFVMGDIAMPQLRSWQETITNEPCDREESH